MLSYEEFKEAFGIRFPEVMGKEYSEFEFIEFPVKKHGRDLDGFTFCSKGEFTKKFPVMKPTFYFQEVYSSYLEHGDINRELYYIADSMRTAISKCYNLSEIMDVKKIRKGVVAELINPKMLNVYKHDLPHREFLNMVIIYRWVVNIDEMGIYSTVIDNNIMESAKLSEEDLYQYALKNTKRILEPKVKSFDQIVRNTMRRWGNSESEIRKCLNELGKDNRMYVLSNKHDYRATTGLIYKELLEEVARKCESDYYIVPTSINEALLVPLTVSCMSPISLYEILRGSNAAYKGDDYNILSDTLYYYSAESGELSVLDFDEMRV
ncbi:MAG: hypothetical protein IJ757_01295 [Clostridiales bacterium]|nr:hypothetical protein [Clostridiales bacterium]